MSTPQTGPADQGPEPVGTLQLCAEGEERSSESDRSRWLPLWAGVKRVITFASPGTADGGSFKDQSIDVMGRALDHALERRRLLPCALRSPE